MDFRSVLRKARVGLVLGVSALAAVLLLALKPEAERTIPSETGRLVETASFTPSPVALVIEAFGTVKPREALSVVAEVRGQIVKLDPAFTEGGFLARGAAFIHIDPRSYQLEAERRRIQLEQSQAELRRLEQEVKNLQAVERIVRSDLALTAEDRERSLSLAAKQVLSKSAADKTEQRYLNTRERLQGIENQLALTGPLRQQLAAQRDMARVMLKQAELDLEKTEIRAPYDGFVLEKAVEVGQNVNAGQPLGRIYRAGELEVDVNIPAKDMRFLPEALHTIEAEVVLDNAGSELVFNGRAARAKAAMEENTRTLPLVIAIAPPAVDRAAGPLGLRPGMFVAVRLKGRTVPEAFVLPRHAVYPGDLVFGVEADCLKSRPVTVLRAHRDQLVVAGGISAGEPIVVTPLSGAADGLKVRVSAPGKSAGTPTAQ